MVKTTKINVRLCSSREVEETKPQNNLGFISEPGPPHPGLASESVSCALLERFSMGGDMRFTTIHEIS
jgi:hypothetical protein